MITFQTLSVLRSNLSAIQTESEMLRSRSDHEPSEIFVDITNFLKRRNHAYVSIRTNDDNCAFRTNAISVVASTTSASVHIEIVDEDSVNMDQIEGEK